MIRIFKIYIQNDSKGFIIEEKKREREVESRSRLERGKGGSRLYRELAVNF